MPKIGEELWRDIPGFDGVYQASYVGRIRSRWMSSGRGQGRGSVKLLGATWRIKKLTESGGYNVVGLILPSGQEKVYRVCRLVLLAFVGPCPLCYECCHGEGGSLNDSLSNICWGSRKKNQGPDRWRDGTHNRGERHGQSKLKNEEVVQIKKRLLRGDSISSLSKLFGMSYHTVWDIKRGHLWGWLEV